MYQKENRTVSSSKELLEIGNPLVLPVLYAVKGELNGGALRHAGPSTEVVFQGVAGGGTAGGDPHLAVNRAEMGFDGQQAHDEFFCDLGIGESSCEEVQHLDLT